MTYKVPSTYVAVRRLLENLKDSLFSKFEYVHQARLELCLAEVLNNIVEHAYKEDTEQFFTVNIDSSENDIRIEINDTGVPNVVLEEQQINDFPVDLPEGGFGLPLVQAIATKIDFIRKDNVNVTTIWYTL